MAVYSGGPTETLRHRRVRSEGLLETTAVGLGKDSFLIRRGESAVPVPVELEVAWPEAVEKAYWGRRPSHWNVARRPAS